jgi:hypothetical protein
MKPEVVFVSITLEDDSVAIMQFVTDDHNGLKQEPTPANIEATITKGNTKGMLPMKRWRIVREDDIPKDREDRSNWRDDGKRIYVHR